jgi:hypothetical protein
MTNSAYVKSHAQKAKEIIELNFDSLSKYLRFYFRLEGFFYKDKYIGKEPNKKLAKRMAKEKKIDDHDDDEGDVDVSSAEVPETRYRGRFYLVENQQVVSDNERRSTLIRKIRIQNICQLDYYSVDSKD